VLTAVFVLAQEDISEIISRVGPDEVMTSVIARLTEGLAAAHRFPETLSPPRAGFTRSYPVPGVIEWMPHREDGKSTTIKIVSYSPANPSRFGQPTIAASLGRFDDVTGEMTVLAEGSILTAIRTGAASAVAARALARKDSRTVGIIGCGAQAVTQLHGLRLLFPIDVVLAWDIDQRNLESLPDRVAFTGLDIYQAPPDKIVEQADIIVTVTSVGAGLGPVLPDGVVRDHLHINAVGSDLVGKTELPLSLLERALVCPDHREQAMREGESQALQPHQLGPTLGEICENPAVFEASRDRLTVFDSTGIALEDHLTLDVLLDLAFQVGVGREVELVLTKTVAMNPYGPALARIPKQIQA
jgi:L-lysine cyclodeaminase